MLHSIIQCFEPECFLRIVISAICGFLIGCERERRAKNAGIRTHILVAISSTLMMEVSKNGFFDVVQYPGISVDASRVAAGVVTAIGFLGAGVIFVRKENTIGLTTSAGLWATVGMGIAIGAGMYATGIAFTIFILILQLLLHSRLLYSTSTTSAELSLIIEESNITIDDIIELHANFEYIHPFQDGNGRVGRLIALKECLRFNIIPFIIEDSKKSFYYRGLANWNQEKGWLRDTCLDGQDTFKRILNVLDIYE